MHNAIVARIVTRPERSAPGFSFGRRIATVVLPPACSADYVRRADNASVARNPYGVEMSKATLKLIASLIVKGQAQIVKRDGKLWAVSKL